MRLFLDASVILAACGSERGASREIFRLAPTNDWLLVTTRYARAEVERNLAAFPQSATAVWSQIEASVLVMDDVVSLDRPVIFSAGKDRPILFSALAWADVLLTLDRGDFATMLGGKFYELLVLKPGVWIERERDARRLREP